MIGTVIALFVAVLVFFGYRSSNTSNIHSYDEGTPEQRAALGGKAPTPGNAPPAAP